LAALFVLLGTFAVTALILGDYELSPRQAFEVIRLKLTGASSSETPRIHEIIVWRIRLPRIFLAALTGMALAISGATYQGCFRNPLVEPFILGISSGAAAGTALAIIWPRVFVQAQLSAFVFALLAVSLSYGLARQREKTPPVALVLSGSIVGALFSALVGIMKYLAADEQLREITFWMMGAFYSANWNDVLTAFAATIPCLLILLGMGWKLNVLSLGDDEARSLGINPDLVRLFFIVTATFAAAICVSMVGIVAWVGLMMPHAARLLLGPDNRWVLPGSALIGAAYLVLCDTVARNLTGAEIPIGIVASILGAPYLLWLIRAKGREMYGA
jgi:iron complex transport system permease protein